MKQKVIVINNPSYISNKIKTAVGDIVVFNEIEEGKYIAASIETEKKVTLVEDSFTFTKDTIELFGTETLEAYKIVKDDSAKLAEIEKAKESTIEKIVTNEDSNTPHRKRKKIQRLPNWFDETFVLIK